MDKAYKKFYEIGNNKYYTLKVEDDLFVATETNIKMSGKLRKNKKLIQGFKLLKMSMPITVLFSEMLNLKEVGKVHEIPKYNIITGELINDIIMEHYKMSVDIAIKDVNDNFDGIFKEIEQMTGKTPEEKKQIKAMYKNRKNNIITDIKSNIVNNDNISYKRPKFGTIPVIDKMLQGDLSFLYSEKLTGFATEHYLFEDDMFGTLTIYRIITLRDTVKSIDTFIYDKTLIEELMKHLKKEGK